MKVIAVASSRDIWNEVHADVIEVKPHRSLGGQLADDASYEVVFVEVDDAFDCSALESVLVDGMKVDPEFDVWGALDVLKDAS